MTFGYQVVYVTNNSGTGLDLTIDERFCYLPGGHHRVEANGPLGELLSIFE